MDLAGDYSGIAGGPLAFYLTATDREMTQGYAKEAMLPSKGRAVLAQIVWSAVNCNFLWENSADYSRTPQDILLPSDFLNMLYR